jgi:hypothetical protein
MNITRIDGNTTVVRIFFLHKMILANLTILTRLRRRTDNTWAKGKGQENKQ